MWKLIIENGEFSETDIRNASDWSRCGISDHPGFKSIPIQVFRMLKTHDNLDKILSDEAIRLGRIFDRGAQNNDIELVKSTYGEIMRLETILDHKMLAKFEKEGIYTPK